LQGVQKQDAAMKRRENVDESEQLDFEMLVPHRKRHHPLIKAGFAEEGLGVPVDQLENAVSAASNFRLQRAHNQKVIAGESAVKPRNSEIIQKNAAQIRSLWGSTPKRVVKTALKAD